MVRVVSFTPPFEPTSSSGSELEKGILAPIYWYEKAGCGGVRRDLNLFVQVPLLVSLF